MKRPITRAPSMTRVCRLALMGQAFACGLAVAWSAEPPPGGAGGQISGYFGDRSGVYRNAQPPVYWNEETNVLWKVAVPNLGSAAPAVTADRVFVLSEPGWQHDLPVISCYATQSGKLLWEKQIDHLHLTVKDEAARQQIREHWRKHLAWIRDYYLLFHDYSADKDNPEVKRRMDAMGVLTWGANYLYGKFDDGKLSDYGMPKFAKKFPEVGKALVELDTWRRMGSHDMMWLGEVFGTPVTDGQALYVATAWGVYASYDLDGNLRWMHALSPERPHDYCAVARSPIIHGNLLISDLGRMVRAFDRATGALKWEHKRPGGVHEFVSPVVLRVGSQDVLWCAGPAAYTLPEGRPLTIVGWKNNGMMIAVNSDRPDTLFMTGGGEHGGWEGKGKAEIEPPAAIRFALEGSTLTGSVLWHKVNDNAAGGCSSLLYHGGKLYFGGAKGVILDAETGNVVTGLFGGAVPITEHHMAIAGGHVYGLGTNGLMKVHTLDGRFVASNQLRVTPFADLDKAAQTRRLSQWFSWPKPANREWCFSFASPFAVAGDRLFIRSLDHLYCIAGKAGAPAPAGDADALIAQAEKNADGAWARLAALGPAAKPVVPRILAQAAKSREPWAAFSALAAIDPDTARTQREAMIKYMVDSNLHDHSAPILSALLYDLGPIPRALLAPLEAKVDQRQYPLNGPKQTQDLLTACYRRAGEVGFTAIIVHPLPWNGGPVAGKEIKLTWSTVNATKVRIEPGIGDVPPKGEHALRLDQPATYTFTAEGPGGPSVRTITIQPKPATAPPAK